MQDLCSLVPLSFSQVIWEELRFECYKCSMMNNIATGTLSVRSDGAFGDHIQAAQQWEWS